MIINLLKPILMKKITLLIIAFILSFTSYSQIVLSEGFDDILVTDWDSVNASTTEGTAGWFQGNATVFAAYDGDDTSYAGANFNATTGGTGTISLWAMLPVLSLKDNDVMTFYTRTTTGSTFPDRLQVRVSADGATSTDPINDSDVGSYTTLLLDINPGLVVGGYPNADWELQTVTITGLGSTTVDAILAFRYFVENGGPAGANSNYIGIDRVEVNQTLSVDEFASNAFSHAYNKDTDKLTLESSSSPFSNVALFNILGQRVINQSLSQSNEVIDMSSLTDGIYLVKVSIQGQAQTIKIIKN